MACTISMASASEDDFLRVLEEMNRLCGEEDDNSTNNNNEVEADDLKLSAVTSTDQAESEAASTTMQPVSSAMSATDSSDPLEDIFETSTESGATGSLSTTSSTAPLIGDQLLSSVASTSTSGAKLGRRAASASNLNNASSSSRSRHCSANSAKSCVSFDSAIGDVYSVQTPTKGTASTGQSVGSSSLGSTNSSNGNNNELDIFDHFSSSGSTSSSPTLGTNSASTATASAGLQFDTLAASVCFDSGEPSADLLDFDGTGHDVDGLGGISLRLVGSEDVDLVGTSFSLQTLNYGNGSDGSLPPSPKPMTVAPNAACATACATSMPSSSSSASTTPMSLKRPAVSLIEDEAADVEYLCKAKRLKVLFPEIKKF